MQGNSWSRAAWETVETVLIALVLALFIRQFIVESYIVQGNSMRPTLQPNERLLVNKLAYRFRRLRDGDIIVFQPPLVSNKDYIKRVVAVGGERVAIRAGRVYVNGRLKPETFLPDDFRGNSDLPPEVVPQGDIFVLGDNRRNSEDSRYFGFVADRAVRGQAIFVWWPVQRLRVLANPS